MLLFTVDCLTVFVGSKRTISIKSNVDGAKAAIIDSNLKFPRSKSTTPGVLTVDYSLVSGDVSVILDKEGYKSEQVFLGKKLNPNYFWNIFNFVGFFVDLGTGALWQTAQSEYTVNLEGSKDDTTLKSIEQSLKEEGSDKDSAPKAAPAFNPEFTDIVFLRNGEVLRCKIIGQTRTTVKVEMDKGELNLSKGYLKRIQYSK